MGNSPTLFLHDAEDMNFIRRATITERQRSLDAENGVFDLDGREVLVTQDLDPTGPLADSEDLPADDTGWAKDAVWYGAQTHDEAASAGYSARYSKGNRRIDLVYYVVGRVGAFDVEYEATTYTVDAEGETTDDDEASSEPVDMAVCARYEQALRVARRCALADERFKLPS